MSEGLKLGGGGGGGERKTIECVLQNTSLSAEHLPVALVGLQDKLYPPTGQHRHRIRPKGVGVGGYL